AGAVSTAHTILWYERFGPTVFKDVSPRERIFGAKRFEGELRFDPKDTARAAERDAEIWSTLVHDERRIGRDAYDAHASKLPMLRPSRPVRLAFAAGADPVRVKGRRPSHSPNAARA